MGNILIEMARISKKELNALKENLLSDRYDLGYVEGQCAVWKIIMELKGIKWEDV